MADYEKDLQLRQYVPILKGKPRYPVIRDANGVVLSMPPIINGERSLLSLSLSLSLSGCVCVCVCVCACVCSSPTAACPIDES